MWGAIGAIVAVPLLILISTIAAHLPFAALAGNPAGRRTGRSVNGWQLSPCWLRCRARRYRRGRVSRAGAWRRRSRAGRQHPRTRQGSPGRRRIEVAREQDVAEQVRQTTPMPTASAAPTASMARVAASCAALRRERAAAADAATRRRDRSSMAEPLRWFCVPADYCRRQSQPAMKPIPMIAAKRVSGRVSVCSISVSVPCP